MRWAFAAAALVFAAGTADAAPAFVSNGWTGGRMAADALRYGCRMSRTNDRGARLAILLDNVGNVGLELSVDGWMPPPAGDLRLAYRIDRDALVSRSAEANGGGMTAWFSGPDYARVLAPFGRDGLVTFYVGENAVRFELPRAHGALNALVDCVQSDAESRPPSRELSLPFLQQ